MMTSGRACICNIIWVSSSLLAGFFKLHQVSSTNIHFLLTITKRTHLNRTMKPPSSLYFTPGTRTPLSSAPLPSLSSLSFLS